MALCCPQRGHREQVPALSLKPRRTQPWSGQSSPSLLSLVTTQPASYPAQRDRKASHPGIPSGVWSLLETVQTQELTSLSGNTFSCFLTLAVRELSLPTSLIANFTGALTFSPATGTHTQCRLSTLGSRTPVLQPAPLSRLQSLLFHLLLT